jgi:hypothetical protein
VGSHRQSRPRYTSTLVRSGPPTSNNFTQFEEQIRRIAAKFATEELVAGLTGLKHAIRAADENRKPLGQYRREELDEMRRNFWGPDPGYHVARSAFVRKRPLERLQNIDAATEPAIVDGGPMTPVQGRLAYATTGWSSTIGDVETI